MMLPPLDVPTLFVVSALVIAFSGFVLILARGRGKGGVALLFWGTAMVFGAAGIVMLSLTPFTELPAKAVGNVAILTGVALSWTGARLFAGRRFRPVLALTGAAVWLTAYLLPWNRSAAMTGVFGFLIGAAYILATAAELWRGRDEPLPTRNAAMILLVVHGIVYLVQAGGTVVLPALFGSPAILLFLMLEALLHTTGMAFLFLALMKERAELRSTLQLRELATHDGLTGLGNRRLFDQMLQDQLRRSARAAKPVALLLIDVDHFKAFNDTYGHQAGDDCLRLLAAVMNKTLHRSDDLAARYGGEEFAVLLPGTDEAGAAVMAEQIRTGIELLEISHSGSAYGLVTVSIGVGCLVPDQSPSQAEALVRIADQALYEAKAAGRNTSRINAASTPP